jgi:pilus assembly protein CpaD
MAQALTLKGSHGRLVLRAGIATALVATTLLAGCARRDHIQVGAVPDDYRTNHPIVVGEKQEVLDIPVGQSDYRASRSHKIMLEGFLAGYDSRSSNVVAIMAPVGSINQAAATNVAAELAELAAHNGVGRGNIVLQNYQAANPNVSAPIRVTYTALRATTGPCGLWPKDIADTTDNKHYANFGCSYQNNLAAQIANPADLIGPRKQTSIDAERRGQVIDDYRKVPLAIPPVNQEVDY